MLRISWKEHKTNDPVKSLIGVKVTQKMDKNKLQYFGHIARRDDNNLDKLIRQGQGNVVGKTRKLLDRWN